MRFFRGKQKTIFALLAVFGSFAANVAPVSAGLFGSSGASVPSASDMATDLEGRYHLDLGAIRSQGESFNVADSKKSTPEVSLFFSPSDPKPGERLSAKAFPVYFSNDESSLYYSWYLKRALCKLTDSPSQAVIDACDHDDDKNITVEDWKIAAVKILAQNGYEGPPMGASPDSDGYKARFGGDNKTNVPDHCYVHDADSGVNYELATGSSTSFSCPEGTSPVCMVGKGEVAAETADFTSSGNVFSVNDTEQCSVSGLPACSAGAPICNVGSPRCVADPTTTTSCGEALAGCSSETVSSAEPYCKHLFPNAKDATSGDGSFGEAEEKFWGTDPTDPDTANNGNKDEASVIGLGRSTFTWNYAPGDEVGVAVEGTSMIPTKHDDASYMIMWVFSKKNCPIALAEGTGSYTKSIRNYQVSIPTADFDLNKCIEKNLVDPVQGGQATNLDINLTTTSGKFVNDATADRGGDVVTVLASANNAQMKLTDMVFDWKVEISKNIQFDDATDITADLRSLGLLGNTKGNALDSVKVKLDMPESLTAPYLGDDGVGYLRFRPTVTENFSSDVVRKGKSDIIVKFTSTESKISAYKADTVLAGSVMKVTFSDSAPVICNEDALDRAACRVIRNEIVGLRVDPTGLSSFLWTVNGAPLICSSRISPKCKDDAQNEFNFLPITGNIGDAYAVTMTANNVVTGNTITLTRAFHIVQPEVFVESLDKNVAWPRFLGQYKDITGKADATACPDGLCNDYSRAAFEAFSGGKLGFRAKFIPPFLEKMVQKEWTVDGGKVAESAPGEVVFTASKGVSGIHAISLVAQVAAPDDIRRALSDIWNISPFNSPEINFSATAQVELQEPGITEGPLQGPRKYLAAIASYIPGSMIFTFRILLSAVLVLFALNFLYATLQDRRMRDFVESIPDKPL